MPRPVTEGSPLDLSSSDVSLIEAIAKARDKAAFKLFFERYAIRVKAFVIKSGMAEADADEIAQDTMVQVWRRAETFDKNKAGVGTWVFTIARNLRIDKLRKFGRSQFDPEDPLFRPDPEPDPQDVLSAAEREARLREALSSLGEEQRSVIWQSFFEGLSHSEIADRLGLPLGTVKSRIRLAFKALKDELGQDILSEIIDG